jgi:single-strand DNA-binding protein
MHLIGLARLGADAELRFTQGGDPVCNLALAFNYGKKDANGKRPTTWLDCSLWGERAQKLQPYLTKGTQVEVHVGEVRLETFTKRDGTQATKLVGVIGHIQFAGGGQQQQGQQAQQGQPAQAPQQRQAPPQQSRGASGFDDMDDSIPF